jgi:hypothetical protein
MKRRVRVSVATLANDVVYAVSMLASSTAHQRADLLIRRPLTSRVPREE